MFSSKILLTTKRLTLRPLRLSDAEALFPYVSDPVLPKYMTWAPHTNIEETKGFIKSTIKRRKDETGLVFGVFINKVFIGLISIDDIQRKLRVLDWQRAEIGYWIGKEYWGQGIMLEAVHAVLHFAFTELKLHKIVIDHFSENTQSARVIEKAGFRYIGEQKKEFGKDGVWYDTKAYEMLAEEFDEKYSVS